jgi:hypothetical protein
MAQKINDAGGNARLIVYDDRGHNVWTPIFSKSDIYYWLIENKKAKL